MTIPKENLLSDEPSTDASPIYQALWWIAKGEFKTGSEWDRAHDICQSDEGKKPYDWVHAPEINSDRQGKTPAIKKGYITHPFFAPIPYEKYFTIRLEIS